MIAGMNTTTVLVIAAVVLALVVLIGYVGFYFWVGYHDLDKRLLALEGKPSHQDVNWAEESSNFLRQDFWPTPQ